MASNCSISELKVNEVSSLVGSLGLSVPVVFHPLGSPAWVFNCSSVVLLRRMENCVGAEKSLCNRREHMHFAGDLVTLSRQL